LCSFVNRPASQKETHGLSYSFFFPLSFISLPKRRNKSLMTLNRSLFLGALLTFGGLLFLAEICLRLSVPTGFWYRHFDLSGDFTSLAELRDRISYTEPGKPRVLLLGDSVLGASAMVEHRIPGARAKTLTRALSARLNSRGLGTLSLGSDGLLLPDIEALTSEMGSRPPDRILLLLNFRMFAKDFAEEIGRAHV
jgi:hypothetical protein